jgi:hypothetical protein
MPISDIWHTGVDHDRTRGPLHPHQEVTGIFQQLFGEYLKTPQQHQRTSSFPVTDVFNREDLKTMQIGFAWQR